MTIDDDKVTTSNTGEFKINKVIGYSIHTENEEPSFNLLLYLYKLMKENDSWTEFCNIEYLKDLSEKSLDNLLKENYDKYIGFAEAIPNDRRGRDLTIVIYTFPFNDNDLVITDPIINKTDFTSAYIKFWKDEYYYELIRNSFGRKRKRSKNKRSLTIITTNNNN
jgi:hypothetical protein